MFDSTICQLMLVSTSKNTLIKNKTTCSYAGRFIFFISVFQNSLLLSFVVISKLA